MVGAYGTFANHGVWTEPVFITRIEDKNGNVLLEYFPENGRSDQRRKCVPDAALNAGRNRRTRRHSLFWFTLSETALKTRSRQNRYYFQLLRCLVYGHYTGL
jgi:penicillin-binding protein 1A